MDISEIQKIEYAPSLSHDTNICFIKDEEGKRIAKQLQDSEVKEMKEKKEIGVMIIGHIGHSQIEIIEALNRNNFQGKVLIITGPESMMLTGSRGPMIKEEHLQELAKTPIVINSLKEDVVEIFLEKEKKPYTDFNKYYVPKTQQSKASRKKYTQRKK